MWVRRMCVTRCGNCFRSPHPKILAACLYHRYLHRSWTPKSPLRFHLLGRGSRRSVSASSSCSARDAPPSKMPCSLNQMYNSPSADTRCSQFPAPLPPIRIRHPSHQGSVMECYNWQYTSYCIGELLPASTASCIETPAPFPPQTSTNSVPEVPACHNRPAVSARHSAASARHLSNSWWNGRKPWNHKKITGAAKPEWWEWRLRYEGRES